MKPFIFACYNNYSTSAIEAEPQLTFLKEEKEQGTKLELKVNRKYRWIMW